MKLIINKDRSVIPVGTWGTVNENNYEILEFEFPAELDGYNKRIVYYLDDKRVWDAIVYNKAYITNAITKYEKVNAYVWLTKNETITLKYVCDGTEEGNYYFTYGNVNYYFTMPEVEENDELIFDVATSTLKLDNTTIATTTTGTGTELTFETIIDAEEDFRTQLFEMQFYENENADGIVPTEEQVDGFNTMLTEMNNKIDEVDALETTIGAAEAQRQEAEATRVSNENTRESNESTRQTNEQTRQEQEAERERRTDEAIGNIEDKTAEYNQNAEEKTEAFNTNATQKTNDFNSNYTQKVNDFNTNASSKKLAFNSNAESKTSTFNTNATNKTNDFNSNASSKTTAFNSNATDKTTNFDNNASSKTTTFNENATSKTNDFNDNASAKTTAFNTNAQEKIDEYDEHIVEYQAQIDDLQNEVEELSENMPWNATEQATEITITDAAKYSRNKLELFGNTEQIQYTGVQLFDENILNQESGYNVYDSATQLWTTNSGGGYGRSILYNATGYANRNIEKLVPLTSAGTYTLKFYDFVNDTGYASAIELALFDNDGLKISQTTQNSNFIKFTIDNSCYMDLCRGNNSGTMSFSKIMMVKGDYTEDTFPDYEPYTNGPSPNPDYPQDIHVVTGENSIGVQGKNFYNATQNTQTKNSLTYSADNEYIYLNGKASSGFNCDFKHFSIPKGTYTMMFELKDGYIDTTNDGGLFYVYGSVSTSAQRITNTNKRRAVTFTLNTDGFVYVHVWPRSSETFSNARIAYQLVKENVADYNFVPYHHVYYPINLGNIELCKIGNYQDYLYKENGNWYKYEAINKIIFNGTESWSNEYTAFSKTALPKSIASSGAYCNRYMYDNRNSNMSTLANYNFAIQTRVSVNLSTVFIQNTDVNSVENFKTLLSSNNVSVYYPLATPTSTQITDETLISQLEAIYNHLALVKGINYITITPSDLSPYMKLNYMQDLPSKLDNLDSRLALLE